MTSKFTKVYDIVLAHRRKIVAVIHIVLIALANFLAYSLRFDGDIPDAELNLMLLTLPWLVIVRGCVFGLLRLYEGLWRYSGIWDLRNIIMGVIGSSILFYATIRLTPGLEAYPRSIIIIDSLLLVFFMGGLRMLRRLSQGFPDFRRKKRVLIYGAGDTGELILRDMKNRVVEYRYNPIGFVDDDPNKIGKRIHGVPVLGSGKSLREIVAKKKPEEIILTIPSAEQRLSHELVRSLESLNVVIKKVPNLREIKDGQINLSQMRTISSEDLLERGPIGLDLEPVQRLIKGKRILVTGAGGSIGSELSRQIAGFAPESLVLLDKAENSLFAIDSELGQTFPLLKKIAVLADIKHTTPLREIFKEYAPQIVLHAAAYKHVPMMEIHPEEAVLNNIIGTCRLSQIAIEHKVENFMLISTDKAVNPTNVMGATKRVAEIYIDSLECNALNKKTIFSAVRFGNVLGSSGSVIPTFRKQIENGGPVTVTHPEITRYFMTIPEAVQLVLLAVTMAQGGEIFVLDMGEPVKLLDMARNLIRSAGLVPDKDITITFIGLRPGEKLHEELIGADEKFEPTATSRIVKIRPPTHVFQSTLMDQISEMERLAIKGESDSLYKLLHEIVPNFHSVGRDGEELSESPGPTPAHRGTMAL